MCQNVEKIITETENSRKMKIGEIILINLIIFGIFTNLEF